MTGRARDLGVRFRFMMPLVMALAAALGVGAAAACTGTKIEPPAPCQGTQCSCEEDPFGPLCKGFNDRPEGGTVNVVDAAPPPDAADASQSEGGDDGGDDAGDGAPGDGGDEAG